VLTVEGLDLASIERLADYDLVFVKGKDERLLDLLQQAEQRGARVINPVQAVRNSKDRAQALRMLRQADVPVPDDYLGPLAAVPFPAFVVKSEFDDDDSTPVMARDPQERDALIASLGPQARVYAQRHIPTQWEFKIYGIGGEFFGFRQRPTLVNPNKLETRRPYVVPDLLADLASRALAAVGLEVGGVDFLGSPQRPLVTDVNSTQGLHNFAEGYAALVRHFLRRLRS